jgi:diguanylate cyclase (GGDEF)-like protein
MQREKRSFLREDDAWSNINEEFRDVMEMDSNVHKALVYVAHSSLMANNGYFMYAVGNASGLNNDSNPGPRELSSVVMDQIPLALSQFDTLVGLAIYGTEQKEINVEQRVRMQVLGQLNNDILAEIRLSVEQGAPYFSDKELISELRATAERWVDESGAFSLKMRNVFIDNGGNVEVPEGLILEGYQIMMSGYKLYYQAMDLIDDSIKHREGALERKRNLTVALLVVLVGIAVTLFLAVSLSVLRSVRLLQRTSLEIAAGNLNARVKLDTKDELKSVEIAFNESVRIFGEILDQKNEMERKITRQAHYDMLTDLPNRFLFYKKLSATFDRRGNNGSVENASSALLYIDLNGFKPVNDKYGHHIGDGLLKEVAIRLMSCISEEDTAARIGGDEFAVIIPNLSAEEEAKHLADRISAELERTFTVDNIDIEISGSIGIALYPQDGDNVDALIQHADKAMYIEKGMLARLVQA